MTDPGAKYKEILLVTLRPKLPCFKPAARGLIQLFFPVTACVCRYRRICPSRFLLPRCSSLVSDLIELFRSQRAKGQENFWSQVEEAWHSYGWPALNDHFSSPLHDAELVSFKQQEVIGWAHLTLWLWRFTECRRSTLKVAKQQITGFHKYSPHPPPQF